MNYYLLEKYLREQGKTEKTITIYLFHIRQFVETHPDYASYEFKHIYEFFAEVNKKYTREDGRVTTTVVGIFHAIKLLYLYLVKNGIRTDLPFPPSYSIKGTRTRGLNTKKLLTPAELEQLMQHVKKEKLRFPKLELRNQVLISLLVYQALTCEEILQLSLHDLDLDAGKIRITATENTNSRILSLHPSQYILFHDYITSGRKLFLKNMVDVSKLVLSTRPMTENVSLFSGLLRKYRLLFPDREMTATVIRQSVIYKWLNHDKHPLETVQQWAGHKWPSTTERYISKVDLDDPEEINGFHPMELL